MKNKLILILPVIMLFCMSFAKINQKEGWTLYKTVDNISFYSNWVTGGDKATLYIKVINNNISLGKQVGFAYVRLYDGSGVLLQTNKGDTKYIKAQSEDINFLSVPVTNTRAVNFSLVDITVSPY